MSPPGPAMLSAIMCHRACRKDSRTEATDSGRLPLSLNSWRRKPPVEAKLDIPFWALQISPTLSRGITSIVDDGYKVASAEGPGASGSPTSTPIAPPYGVTVSPATQKDGARPGNTVAYTV